MNISTACNELSAWPNQRLKSISAQAEYLDCGQFWIEITPTNNTHNTKHRLLMNNCGQAAGYNRFKSRDSLLRILTGKEDEYYGTEELDNIARKNKYCARAIEYYEKRTHCTVSKRGLVIPKWNPWIGAKIDGEIIGQEGIVKVECPHTMYSAIVRYNCIRQTNPNACLRDAIWKPNYFEIQGNLALMGKQWCDYVIYVPKDRERQREGSVGIYRVDFDADYWNRFIYPRITEFVRDLKIRLPPETEANLIPTSVTNFWNLSRLSTEKSNEK